MRDYLRSHEERIKRDLALGRGRAYFARLAEFHEQQTGRMQHERLIHLLVTLSIGLFLLISIGLSLFRPGPGLAVLSALFLVLETAYVIHYFRLENGVQRWYKLGNRIRKKAGLVSGEY
jgi:hypothetical protein